MSFENLENIEVLILCGGLGTRIRSVLENRPKGLAPLQEKPFLEVLVEQLKTQGFQKFILCVGHLKEQIVAHFSTRKDLGTFLFSEEESPLGTGGAVKHAETLVRGETVLVVNGDSLCEVDFSRFVHVHFQNKAFLSIVLSLSEDVQDYGSVEVDNAGKIVTFHEKKAKTGQGLINAGIYLMQRKALALMPETGPFSLEVDFFPEVLQTGRCFGWAVNSKVWDIGTPERYEKIRQLY